MGLKLRPPPGGSEERGAERVILKIVLASQTACQSVSSFLDPSSLPPELRQGDAHGTGLVSLAAREGPVQSGPEIVLLGFQTAHPERLLGAVEMRLSFLRQATKETGMLAAYRFLFPTLAQLLQSVLVHRFQQTVADLTRVLCLDVHQRLVHQLREIVQHLPLFQRLPGADRLRRGELPASRKERQPAQQHPLRLAQQLVTPLDRRPQGLLPRQRRPAAAGEQAKPIVQTLCDLVHR